MKIERIRKTSAQTITLDSGAVVLVSYSTPVACFIPGEGYFRTDKKWSTTTSKQVNQWLRSERGDSDAPTRSQEWFSALLDASTITLQAMYQ